MDCSWSNSSSNILDLRFMPVNIGPKCWRPQIFVTLFDDQGVLMGARPSKSFQPEPPPPLTFATVYQARLK